MFIDYHKYYKILKFINNYFFIRVYISVFNFCNKADRLNKYEK